jgi:putative transposase
VLSETRTFGRLAAAIPAFESTESWAGVFRDLKRRGLNEPKLVVGDGALGAWAALRDVFPAAGEQRCWFHASAT